MKKNYFVRILILWFALCTGIFTMLIIVLILPIEPQPELKNKMEYISVAFMLAVSLAGKFLYQNLLNTALQKSILNEKLQAFLSAVLIYGALIEGASVFAFVTYMLTKTLWVLGVGGAGLVIMLLQTPTRQKCIQDLQLSQEEIAQIS